MKKHVLLLAAALGVASPVYAQGIYIPPPAPPPENIIRERAQMLQQRQYELRQQERQNRWQRQEDEEYGPRR